MPAVEEAVTLKSTVEPTITGLGRLAADVMFMVVVKGVKTAIAKLFFWLPLQVAVNVSDPPLSPAM